MAELKAGPLAHCTLQVWLPDKGSEKHFYLNDAVHGKALAELPITNGGQDLLKVLTDASKSAESFQSLSAVKAGYFPLNTDSLPTLSLTRSAPLLDFAPGAIEPE